MLNKVLMEKEIKESGLKKVYIANKMGLTSQGFYKKIQTGRFTTDEANDFCDALGIKSNDKKCLIFFANSVDKNKNIL